MNHFFITGLPRSRTVWLANLMTYGPAFCLHDGSKAGSAHKLLMDMEAAAESLSYAGDSDSGLPLMAEALIECLPHASWVVVNRAMPDAFRSFLSYFSKHTYPGLPLATLTESLNVFDFLKTKLDAAKALIPKKHLIEVEFDDLKNEPCVRAVWEHCIPGVRFNRERWKMLNTFRMTIIAEKVPVPADYMANVRGLL